MDPLESIVSNDPSQNDAQASASLRNGMRPEGEDADEARFQHVAENTGEWIWEVDAEGRYTYSNSVVEKLLGYRPEEVIGHLRPLDLVPPEDQERLGRAISDVRSRRKPFTGFIGAMIHRDGRRVVLEMRGVPLFDDNGRLRGFRGTKTDITRRIKAEKERQLLEERVQETQRLESLGLLAGGIAHDFNNLLGIILGELELAAQDLGAPHPTMRRLVRAMETCESAAGLCREMQAFSGQGPFMLRPVALNEALREGLRMLELSVGHRSRLELRLAEGLPPILGDASQIRQAVVNLALNASEAMEGNGGIVTIRTAYVKRSEARENEGLDLAPGEYAIIEVTDTGCGMSADVLRRVFEPFFTTKFTGRGLGLAAVRGIAKSHGGAAHLRSIKGVGTVATLYFPAHPECIPAPVAAPPIREAWKGEGLILLADDEPILREVGAEALERMGFSVVTARDGLEALALYQIHREDLACILLDVVMPRMDGAQVLKELIRQGNTVPVIVASGFPRADLDASLNDASLAEFIQKPYTANGLRSMLARILGPKAGGPVKQTPHPADK